MEILYSDSAKSSVSVEITEFTAIPTRSTSPSQSPKAGSFSMLACTQLMMGVQTDRMSRTFSQAG